MVRVKARWFEVYLNIINNGIPRTAEIIVIESQPGTMAIGANTTPQTVFAAAVHQEKKINQSAHYSI